MTLLMDNLLTGIPSNLAEELVQTLAESGSIRIERIVSDGHVTATGEWYDQEWNEWVLLIAGGATLSFDNNVAPLTLKPGDHIMIPAHCRHRVEQTISGEKTIWLAVHFNGICTP